MKRSIISIILLLILVPILYLTLRYINPAMAAWHGDNYLYRTELTFGDPGASSNRSNEFFAPSIRSTLGNVSPIVAKDNGSATGERLLEYDQLLNLFTFDIFDSSTSTWCFIVARHDCVNDRVRIQVNNDVIDGSSTGGIGITDTGETMRHFNGRINNVLFWKRTLTSGDRTSLYTNGRGLGFGNTTFAPISGPTPPPEETTPSPVVDRKLDEGHSTTTKDTSVNNNAFTLLTTSGSASHPGVTVYILNRAHATWNPNIASYTTANFYDTNWHHIFSHRDGTDNGDKLTGDVDGTKIYPGILSHAEILADFGQGSDIVMETLSDNSNYDKKAANQGYCVSGACADDFSGQTDDVRIYDYTLTGSRAKNIMNEGATVRFGPSTG